ncbi:MAG: hypothetical protein ACFE9N_01090 [Promethearchaeota archaeon]
MKKSKYGIIGTLLIIIMMFNQISLVTSTDYTCATVIGAEAIWEVKTSQLKLNIV